MINKNSMTYWWPRIKNLEIPMPKTIIIPIDLSFELLLGIIDGDKAAAEAWDRQLPTILKAIDKVGLPAFLRTDYLSDKHDWKNSCFVTEPDLLRHHISELVEMTAMADLSLTAIVVREYIEMASVFTAFSGDLPINPERRYFIRNGEIQCHHPYWIETAIADWDDPWLKQGLTRLPTNWKELLAEVNTETDIEIQLLSNYAKQVIAVMPDYWSVDFCKTKDGRWVLIDMALGEASWHDKRCEYSGD